MFFVIIVRQFHAIKYNSLLSIVSARVESEVLRLGIQKTDEGGEI